MSARCPLMCRKVAKEAVEELLGLAWRCDGWGYAWRECVAALSMDTNPVRRSLESCRTTGLRSGPVCM